ncbi:MAG TPA: type II toxin-antitoxin system RelE/ParE family toxin [Pirellulales bacterium]|jgi:plasmid stabilization system protein ParE
MAHATKTPAALLDIDRILHYISHDNLPAALRWLAEIEQLFDLLAVQPDIGQAITTRRFGKIRRRAIRNYIVYYRSVENGVQILKGGSWGSRPESFAIIECCDPPRS